MNKHKDQSRTSSSGVFKGGLADSSDKTIRYHTATHLVHQALRNSLGDEVRQEGSHITGERLRFDFRFNRLPNKEELEETEKEINEMIINNFPVRYVEMNKDEAEKSGALSFFREKYPDVVKIYYIGEKENDIRGAYSKEFCGGPHVKFTGEIGQIKIDRVKKIGTNIVRIYLK
jgi:alanyl-tRNA synthetase